jgi:hypothetical protein
MHQRRGPSQRGVRALLLIPYPEYIEKMKTFSLPGATAPAGTTESGR